MNHRESEKAAEEAREEMTRPQRPVRYSEAALRYLQQIGYAEARRKGRQKAEHNQSSDEAG